MKWLVTGGAGFIGCNAARRLLEDRHDVVILDNLSRPGSSKNLEWLKALGDFEFVRGDVRDAATLKDVFSRHSGIDAVLHLAAQVAVTTSVLDPKEDFEINLLGTFNLLEVVRQYSPKTIFLNASTNKVYGKMEDILVHEKNGRYIYRDLPGGMSETFPVDFHSPYGCSKGAAEQYVRDAARIYGLKTVSFRQSCIYGMRQFGLEDQGWVAWFMIAAATGRPIRIYGDGKQVRDILAVDDLIDCYLLAAQNIVKTAGRIYNIGGGPEQTLSLLELIAFLEENTGRKLERSFHDWRPGDQPVYVSDISKAKADFGWKPQITKYEGLLSLWNWVEKEKDLFKEVSVRKIFRASRLTF